MKRTIVALTSLALLGGLAGSARAGFLQTNLVSDIPGMAANTDPNLKNPWGISSGPASPFWVSNQVSGNSTLYNGAGTPQALVVTIPGGNPTGQVFNPTPDFALATGGRALFLFATLNGTITGWNGAQGTNARVAATSSGPAVYTGLALGNNAAGNFLYAANVLGGIDIYNGAFAQTTLAGSFTDPNLPSGFVPFNVQNLAGTLYVTYENVATGGGVVNAFDTDGNFLRRVTANGAGGTLDNPWGLALAPAGFGDFGGALLVGNLGNGRISAFDPLTGEFLGQLLDEAGNPIANPGLWGLRFGNGGAGGDRNLLFFSAGINGGQNGLFGSIQAVPEPAGLTLLVFGALGVVGYARRRKAAAP